MGSIASPREETSPGHLEPKARLPAVALTLTSGALGMAVLLTVLVAGDFVEVPWDSHALPNLVLFGLAPFSIIGIVVSGISWYCHRDWRSVISVALGLLAIAASLLALAMIIGTAMAGHPL